LHPRYKTTYFTKHGWPAEWISTAVGLLRAEWEKNYKPFQPIEMTPGAHIGFFKEIDNFGLEEGVDLCDEYLMTPTVKSVKDPLAYWSGMANDGNVFAMMAIDILSAPG
ncbi:hypothetical protein BD410DRAFT_700417, partial [Rickenella mellea]